MREFDTGATRDTDEGKLDFEGFLSHAALVRYAKYMNENRVQADGNVRPSDNWQKGIPQEVYMKSAFRHFMDWWKCHRNRDDVDPQFTQTSLCALLFNVLGYLHEELKITSRAMDDAFGITNWTDGDKGLNVDDDFYYRVYGPEETMPHYDTMNPVHEVPLQQDIMEHFGREDLPEWVELYEYGGRFWVVADREVWSVKADELARRPTSDEAPEENSYELPSAPTMVEMAANPNPLRNVQGRVVGVPDWLELTPRSLDEAIIKEERAADPEDLIRCGREFCNWNGYEHELYITIRHGHAEYICPTCDRVIQQVQPPALVEPADEPCKCGDGETLRDKCRRLLRVVSIGQNYGMGEQRLIDKMLEIMTGKERERPGGVV
jgi:hypothetical protein